MKQKIFTQRGLILDRMSHSKIDWFFISDFCGGDSSCPYIGYKAAARIGELQKEGILTSRWSDRKTAFGKRLKKYKIRDNVEITSDGEYLTITLQEKSDR